MKTIKGLFARIKSWVKAFVDMLRGFEPPF